MSFVMNRAIGDISFNGLKPTLGGQAVATIDDITSSQLTYKLYVFTATLNQSSFTGLDDNSALLEYTPEKFLVIVNGVILHPTDYTATNGSVIILNQGVPAGTEVLVQSFNNFTVGVAPSKYVNRELIATAGQTVFSIIGEYEPLQLQVTLNGIKQNSSQVDTSSGTEVVFTTPTTAGDVIIANGFRDGILNESALGNLYNVVLHPTPQYDDLLVFDNIIDRWVNKSKLEANVESAIHTIQVLPSPVINGAIGNWLTRTAVANETLSFVLASGQSVFVTVIPNGFTVSLANVNKWVGGSAPSTVEPEHAFRFWSEDGTTIIGHSLGGIA